VRIVAGRFKGAALHAPKGLATRPTGNKVRQALFNILQHGTRALDLEGVRVLDLFAGSGALGIEALSRRARFALFVEESAEARGAIRRNVEALGLTGATKIWRRDATKLGPIGTLAPFDLVFCDPPYAEGLGEKALAAAMEGGWLSPGAVAVLEERAEAEIALPSGFEEMDRRIYGDTLLLFARYMDEN
jgi:16S rRNA (guanine966-N2)-methyltransferase